MRRIDEHDPTHLVGVHLRKDSNEETAKRGADQNVRRRQTRRAKSAMQLRGDLAAVSR